MVFVDAGEASAIGARARKIRTRRGLSLDVAAGLAGISKGYLSMLEHGQRGFNRRGLIEDLADALGCSVADLTGQPYLPPDRESALAKAVIAQIERGLNEATLDDVPDLQPRPLDALDDWARSAMELRDTASYRSSGESIDNALIELQVHLAPATAANGSAPLDSLLRPPITRSYWQPHLVISILRSWRHSVPSTRHGSPNGPSWRRSPCSPERLRWHAPAAGNARYGCWTVRSMMRGS
jgi:transcriptional regulator with XRE-family HTH domain